MLTEAREDLLNLSCAITNIYKSPLTAVRYLKGIEDTIKSLAKHPEVYPIRHNTLLKHYGINMRRANYKKMAIIYTIQENTVYIHRVMAGNMILE